MEAYITGRGVTAVHGESGSWFHVVDITAPESEQPAILASYRDHWRAQNHAIAGCPYQSLWHLYHGDKHETGIA